MRTVLAALLALAALAHHVRAGGPETGSLLVFPEFDNRTGHRTYLTITNTDPSRSVRVHLNLVSSATCLVSNRTVTLTPRDTYTALTSALAGSGQRGYVWAYAQSTTTGRAIDFDWLAGSSLRVDGTEATDYSIPPFVYRGLTGDGQNTDADGDWKPDLDGIEYERSPSRICVPRFFGQAASANANAFVSDLVLLQPLAPGGVTTTVGFLVFNDNEQVFSAQRTFTCWSRTRLLSISGIFGASFLQSTGHAAGEVVGQTTLEAGWFEVDGLVANGPGNASQSSPPILGVLIDLRPNSGADLPFLVR